MKVRSTIKEINRVIIDTYLDNDKLNHNSLKINNYTIEEEGILKASIYLQYCKDFCIVAAELDLYDSVTDIIEVEGDVLFLGFLSEGNSNLQKENLKEYDVINVGALYRSYVRNLRLTIKMPANKKIKYCSIYIRRDYLLELLATEVWTLKDPFFQMVRKEMHVPIGEQSVPVNDTLMNALISLVRNNVGDTLKKTFLEMKLKELYILYLDQYNTSTNKNVKISTDDQRKLLQARAYLTINYMEPPTIRTLSKIISLNELKLKKGFKLLFGMTIHAYIIQLRMRRAEELMQNKQIHINEIAFELGYKSVSHFIVMFKNYYNITPKQFLDRSQN